MDTQSAKVTKVTEDSVFLSIQNQTLTWPKEHLENLEEGDEVYVAVMLSPEAQEHHDSIAKSILNSVLNPKE